MRKSQNKLTRIFVIVLVVLLCVGLLLPSFMSVSGYW